MAALVKTPIITYLPGTPGADAAGPIPFRLYAPPSPQGKMYRHKNGFPDSPDDFNTWSQLTDGLEGLWYGPIMHMEYITFPGVTTAPNGYPLGAEPVMGEVTIPTPTGFLTVQRMYRSDGLHGSMTPYAEGFVDPPYCFTGGPCGVMMFSGFPGRPAVPEIPGQIITDHRDGWNAGANSIDTLDGNVRTVFIEQIQSGGCVGFVLPDRASNAPPESILFGWYFDTDVGTGDLRASVIESGLIRYSEPRSIGSEYEVRREDGAVAYVVDGFTAYRSTAYSVGPLRVGTALYRAGDTIE